MAVQIQVRRDTAANWTAVNPTLAQGEWGYETDTGKVKIGDGVTAWTALDYLTPGGAPIAHKDSHEDGGTDEISLTGLEGSEIRLTPKAASTGAEGTIFYDSDDDHIWVATE